WGFYIASGTAFAIGLLIKPSLLYWPLAMFAVAALLSRALERRIAWGKLAITALLPLMAAGAWSVRNWRVEGGFTYCSVDAQNLRQFLAPLTEEWAKAGRPPAGDDLYAHHAAVRDRDWSDMADGRLSPMQLARRQRAESLAILSGHPVV